MENPIKMDDLGVPLFSESKCRGALEKFRHNGSFQNFSNVTGHGEDVGKFSSLVGGNSNILNSFTPEKLGEDAPHFEVHMFSDGF